MSWVLEMDSSTQEQIQIFHLRHLGWFILLPSEKIIPMNKQEMARVEKLPHGYKHWQTIIVAQFPRPFSLMYHSWSMMVTPDRMALLPSQETWISFQCFLKRRKYHLYVSRTAHVCLGNNIFYAWINWKYLGMGGGDLHFQFLWISYDVSECSILDEAALGFWPSWSSWLWIHFLFLDFSVSPHTC